MSMTNSIHTRAPTNTYLIPPSLYMPNASSYGWSTPRVYDDPTTGHAVTVIPIGEEAWFGVEDVITVLGEPRLDPVSNPAVRLRSRLLVQGHHPVDLIGDTGLKLTWQGLTGDQLRSFRWLRAISIAVSCERAERRLRERGYFVEEPQGYTFPSFTYRANAAQPQG